MQVEKPGKIPRGGGGGGGGGYDKHPLEWKIQGMGSKGYEYFLRVHNNLSYFWFLSTKIEKKCILN